jgi:hypothetical protein
MTGSEFATNGGGSNLFAPAGGAVTLLPPKETFNLTAPPDARYPQMREGERFATTVDPVDHPTSAAEASVAPTPEIQGLGSGLAAQPSG